MGTGTVDGVGNARATADASLDRLATGAGRWAARNLAERGRLLLATHRAVGDTAVDWVRVACAIKGIDERLAGEEWLSGPYAALTALAAYAETLQALEGGRSPVDGFDLVDAPGGRRAVRVLPHAAADRLLLSGHRVDVWFPPGVGDEQIRATAGLAQRDPDRRGGVGVVLGAGNVTAIAPLDALYGLLAHGRASLVKLNPITDPLLPVLRRAFAPLIDADALRVHADDGLGPYLVGHRAVDQIHLTGSAATYDTVVHGSVERKARGDKLISAPITAELGGVSPIIVVPGRWAAADLRHQAEHVATMRLHNNGYNCIAGQVLIVAADWAQRAEFMAEVQAAMARAPHRRDYYPGSAARVRAAADTHSAVSDLDGRLVLPGIVAGDRALRTEYFAPVLAIVELPGAGIDYLRRAVDFANTDLVGTLGANIIALPAQVRTGSFQRAVADLRYGAIGVNAWTGFAFMTARAPWGAFPGGGDTSSGVGIVHNALLLDGPERTVATGPFRPLPRSLGHGEPA
jgi:aldehyde dehydrogenase (NAD(P)+)